jgi:hypothetical protein
LGYGRNFTRLLRAWLDLWEHALEEDTGTLVPPLFLSFTNLMA